MAASVMIRCRLCCRLRQPLIRHASASAYYVLLPEVPPDTPESNPVMRVNELPKYSEINPDNCITGCAKLAIQYDVGLGKHLEEVKGPEVIKNFKNVFEPIERLSVPLNYAWRTTKNLNYVQSTLGYKTAFQRVHPQVERARNERWISEPLYRAVKEVDADSRNFTETEKRVVDMYKLEARLNGIDIFGEDKTKFIERLGKLVDAKGHFRNRVMLSHNMFSHVIDDFSLVVDMPKELVSKIAVDSSNPSRGPWKVTLNQDVYQPFLEYCPNRMQRWNIWQAYNTRSSIAQDEQNLSNHNVIKDIREHRKELAKGLGYENFAQMSMETKMAGSVENVLNMIETLKGEYYDKSAQEVAQLQEYAVYEGFQSNLEMWDIAYWRRRHREHKFSLDAGAVAEYFPLPKVLDGLFSLCRNMFGINIKESQDSYETWQPGVKLYDVFDTVEGNRIASFFLDPYMREGKLDGSWMEPGRDYSQLMGTTPFSYLNLNLSPPFGTTPSLLTVDEVSTLFFEFGHGLQQMLTTAPYSEVSGQQNIEWDSLQTCSTLMSMIFYHPTVLRQLSSHHETGQPLSEEMITSILDVKKHMSSYDMMRQLYFAAFDMEIYVSDDHWVQTMKNVWAEFVPIQMAQDDSHPCSLTAIFSDQYPAGYYSFKWAEMVAADIFKAFDDAGFDNPEKLGVIGRRFRDTFLSYGGSISAGEVFRRFRGRDPTLDALVEYHKKS